MHGRPGGVWSVVAREYRRALSRPLYVLLTIVFPLATFGMLASLFSAGKPVELPIAVCDRDHSALSRKLVRLMDATQAMRVAHRVGDLQQGRALIESNEAYALILIPENMERNVYAGKSPKIVGYYNNQYLLPAGLVARDMQTVVATVSAGINIKTRQKKGESLQAAMEHVSPVTVDHHTLFNPTANNAYYLVPLVLPNMLQIFVLLTTVFVLGIELREGTGRELIEHAGGSIVAAVAGKLLPYTILFFLMANVANAFVFLYFGIPIQGSIRMITAVYFVYILAYQSLAILLLGLFPNFRMALSLAGIYCSPALAFTGATFPVVAMPFFGKIWSSLLPMTYFFQVFIDQAFRGASIQVSLFPATILCLFAILGPGLMLWRLKQVYTEERYWGRT